MHLSLRDIHLPEEEWLWWPLAPGWYAVGAFIILAFVLFFYWRKLKNRKSQVKASLELKKLYQQYMNTQDQHQYMQHLSILMRRICLRHFPATEVAALHGQTWLTWLDQTTKNQIIFSEGIGMCLTTAPYNHQQTVDIKQLHQLCQAWLKILEKNSC